MSLHTDIPSQVQIQRLLQAHGEHLVSIYLPTSPITPEADASRIAFKNLAARAVDYGVVDELCRRVILAGGRVLAVRAADVPGGGPAAAILRYAV